MKGSRAVSSGPALFAKISVLVYRDERVTSFSSGPAQFAKVSVLVSWDEMIKSRIIWTSTVCKGICIDPLGLKGHEPAHLGLHCLQRYLYYSAGMKWSQSVLSGPALFAKVSVLVCLDEGVTDRLIWTGTACKDKFVDL